MHRRAVLGGVAAGLVGALAGCSTAAGDQDADETTNDLVLVNHMGAPTTFELEANGPTNRALTYEVEPNTARVIENYIQEGSYGLTVDNEIEVEADDGDTETVTRTVEGQWSVEACHTCKIHASRSDVEIELEDCTTETPAPTTDTETGSQSATNGTATGTGS
jgi:hypothetical protein